MSSFGVFTPAQHALLQINTCRVSYGGFLGIKETVALGKKLCIPIASARKLFGFHCLRGRAESLDIRIHWHAIDVITDNRVVYSGEGTCQVTSFSHDFPLLSDDMVGSLLVFSKTSFDGEYEATVLDDDDNLEVFMNAYGMLPTDIGRIIEKDVFALMVSFVGNLVKSE